MLREGQFVADVLFYNGDWAPNIVEPKHINPSLGKGYDYDVCNEEIILTRLSVKDGLLMLPDGMTYRMLVLPDSTNMPAGTLKKIASLVADGATVVGRPPQRDPGLKNYPECDREVQSIASEVWGKIDGVNTCSASYGKGRVFFGKDLRSILLEDGIQPDFETDSDDAHIDFIHRTTDEYEFYFIANLRKQAETVNCVFRVSGCQPELWDPVTAKKITINEYQQDRTHTQVPVEFAGFQSFFVVFPRKSKPGKNKTGKTNFPKLVDAGVLPGSWTVRFDPGWGGPSSVEFQNLEDWTQRPEDGIRYYSGKATYYKQFDFKEEAQGRVFLDLGVVKDIAEVRLNGENLGVVWTSPWRVEVTGIIRTEKNQLEVDIINQWPNRLLGDAGLPEEQRLTRTNIVLRDDMQLMPSGLIGPVSIRKEIM